VKLQNYAFVGGAILLSGAILGYRYLNAPPDPKLEANISALSKMGVPTTLSELEATRADGTPDAAIAYDKAIAQYHSGIAALSQADRDGLQKLKVGQPVSAHNIKLIDSLEPAWTALQYAANKGPFVPNRKVMDWELDNSMVSNGHYELCSFANSRFAAKISSKKTDQAFETVELTLKVGDHIGQFPGLAANGIGVRWLQLGLIMAGQLAESFPDDEALNKKLLALVESQDGIDSRRAYFLQPAIAFTILDSKKRIPVAFAPNGYQNQTPEPAKRLMLESRTTRERAKAILADHFRNVIENFPEDTRDSQATSKLVQDERLDPRTFEGELASNLAIPHWRVNSGQLVYRSKQDALAKIKSNLSK
jgi:hypothetical protein